jgi:hypothetical protein
MEEAADAVCLKHSLPPIAELSAAAAAATAAADVSKGNAVLLEASVESGFSIEVGDDDLEVEEEILEEWPPSPVVGRGSGRPVSGSGGRPVSRGTGGTGGAAASFDTTGDGVIDSMDTYGDGVIDTQLGPNGTRLARRQTSPATYGEPEGAAAGEGDENRLGANGATTRENGASSWGAGGMRGRGGSDVPDIDIDMISQSIEIDVRTQEIHQALVMYR